MRRGSNSSSVLAHGRRPLFRPIVERDFGAKKAVSACLFHEPEYAKLFPDRDFEGRYLSSAPAIRRRLDALGYAPVLFCDEASVERAVALNLGSVYLVEDTPLFPFSQHLYRYYAAFLSRFEVIHFRGLDNMDLADYDAAMMARFDGSGCDLYHAPYSIHGMYFPIRGSCGVRAAGIDSLAAAMCHEPFEPVGSPRDRWHCDEANLARWFAKERRKLRLFTVVDRRKDTPFFVDFQRQIELGSSFELHFALR